MSDRPTQVTQILADLSADDSQAAARLLPLVYEELRSLASHKLANEPPDHTLQATALVHEAYLRLLGSVHQNWDNRGHFFAAAAEAMRRILVERAANAEFPSTWTNSHALRTTPRTSSHSTKPCSASKSTIPSAAGWSSCATSPA